MRDMWSVQRKLEIVTGKWWFLVAFILVGMTPPIVEKGYDLSKTGTVVYHLLANSLLKRVSPLYPVFKAIPIALILSLVILGDKVGRVFNLYVALNYVLFAFLQGISVTERYGFSILTGNVLQILITSVFWFWETSIKRNSFKSPKVSLKNCWTIPLSLLAFWYPLNPETLGPDLNPTHLLTNAAGLAFCNMTPVYLTVLTLYYPSVNKVVMRVTSLTGIVIGSWNMIGNFILIPRFWWNGILHLPLVSISLYALVLSFKDPTRKGPENR